MEHGILKNIMSFAQIELKNFFIGLIMPLSFQKEAALKSNAYSERKDMKYHITINGHQITTQALTLLELIKKYGRIQILESNGYILVSEDQLLNTIAKRKTKIWSQETRK